MSNHNLDTQLSFVMISIYLSCWIDLYMKNYYFNDVYYEIIVYIYLKK